MLTPGKDRAAKAEAQNWSVENASKHMLLLLEYEWMEAKCLCGWSGDQYWWSTALTHWCPNIRSAEAKQNLFWD